MRKFLAVVTREFRERVRTRAFVISTVLIPLFFTLMIVGQIVLSTRGPGPGASPWWTRPKGRSARGSKRRLRDVKGGNRRLRSSEVSG